MDAVEIVRFVLAWGTDPDDPTSQIVDEDFAVNGWDDNNIARCASALDQALKREQGQEALF